MRPLSISRDAALISALTDMASVVRCITNGAEDYLPKPFNPTLLKARVGASLEKKRLRDELEAHVARIEAELDSARLIQSGTCLGFGQVTTWDSGSTNAFAK